MENNDSKLLPVTDIRKKYKLSGLDLKEKLIELKLDLLVRRPANVDIYASGSVIAPSENKPKTFKDYHKKHQGTPFSDEHDFYTKLRENVSFITISPAEWFEMINLGKALVNRVQSIYFQSTDGLLTKKTAQQIIKNTPSPPASFVIDSGIFFSSRSGPLSAMDILLAENDIYIKSLDADKLLKDHLAGNSRSNSNSTPKDYWMSEKLADLNLASELFISTIAPETTTDNILKTVEDWLRARWDTTSERLIEQAALAIIPDGPYESVSKKPNNATGGVYRSRKLTIINEVAKAIEDKFLETGGKREKATTIQLELINKHHFTTNLAIAASTIINLKKRKNKKINTR